MCTFPVNLIYFPNPAIPFYTGRSAMIMCATLVKAGFYSTWEEAFEKGVKPKRPVSEECSCD